MREAGRQTTNLGPRHAYVPRCTHNAEPRDALMCSQHSDPETRHTDVHFVSNGLYGIYRQLGRSTIGGEVEQCQLAIIHHH